MKKNGFLSAAASLTVSLVMLWAPAADVMAAEYPSPSTCDYYYDQFDRNAQKLYDDLLSVSKMIDESTSAYSKSQKVYYSGMTSAQVSDLMKMFSYDHPEFFWISNRYSYGYSGSRNYVQLEVYAAYQDGAARKTAREQIIAAEQAYIDGALQYESDYDRARYLTTTLKNNVTYGTVDNYLDQSLASVFLYKQTVCAGFTKAYSLLANAVGVDTVALRSPVHAWNASKVGENWYVDDVTNRLFLYSDAEIAQFDQKAGIQELVNPDGTVKQSLMHELDYDYFTDIFPDTSRSYDGTYTLLTAEPQPTEPSTTEPVTEPATEPVTEPVSEPLELTEGKYTFTNRSTYYLGDDTRQIAAEELVESLHMEFTIPGGLNYTFRVDIDPAELEPADGWATPAEILRNHAGGKGYYHGGIPVVYGEDTFLIGDAWILQRGDMTMDGVVNAKDATAILISAANVGTGKGPKLPDSVPDQNASLLAAKYVNDGAAYPTANDAAAVLIYAARVGTGQTG